MRRRNKISYVRISFFCFYFFIHRMINEYCFCFIWKDTQQKIKQLARCKSFLTWTHISREHKKCKSWQLSVSMALLTRGNARQRMQQKLYDKNVIITVKTITIIIILYRKYFMFQMIFDYSLRFFLLLWFFCFRVHIYLENMGFIV